jgi:site-specific DNA-methyltransferase (adenine-specific)
MKHLEDGEVSLTVTSPPYWNAIDYDRHARNNTDNYRAREYSKGFGTYEEYLEFISLAFEEVLRVTKPGGFLAIIIGTVLADGKHLPAPFDVTHRLVRLGWEFHQDVIWHKCTAGVKRAGVFIQKPFPGYFYPNIMTEYILIFRKPGPKILAGKPESLRRDSAVPINGLFTKDIANNIWHIAPVPPGTIDHPCPFPEEIPARLIALYSYKDDLVLDPFVGSGQTTKVAVAMDRRAAGYDIEAAYIALAKARAKQPPALRAQQLIAEFAKIDIDAPLQGKSRSGKTRHGSGRAASRTLDLLYASGTQSKG